jgi:hypothetical protein
MLKRLGESIAEPSRYVPIDPADVDTTAFFGFSRTLTHP